ncbi:MAG: thioredoxin-like domain-containing protein [Planctomyces sp.]
MEIELRSSERLPSAKRRQLRLRWTVAMLMAILCGSANASEDSQTAAPSATDNAAANADASAAAEDTTSKAETPESAEPADSAKPEATQPGKPTDDTAKPDAPEDPFAGAMVVPDGILDGGAEWLNTSRPLSIRDLRGKIVLIDFWTYCCINCMHVLPDLKYLEEKYPDQLVVIGVHSAKFENEKLSQNIRDAIQRYEIRHPVVNDNEMLIWRKFGTRAWPTLALIDAEGRYIGAQGGEGNRELFDTVIAKLIEYSRAKGVLNETPMKFDLEADKATPTPLRYPGKVLADTASDSLFITDSNHNRIVITDLNGKLKNIIGTGTAGRRDGSFSEAEFNHPQGTVLVNDTLYVADTENHLIRSISLSNETVSTLAGTGTQGHPGEPDDRPLPETNLNSPWSICHVGGTLYIAMAGPHQIWSHRIGTDRIAAYAGSGREDVTNGPLPKSAFAQPSEIVANAEGTFLFVVDSEGSSVRQVPVDPAGNVTTIAGTSELPRGQSLFAFGDVDATGADARFQHPLGIAVDGTTLYVADSYNHKIRRVDSTNGNTTTLIGTGTAGNSVEPPLLSEPGGLSFAGGRLYIADTNNHRIGVLDPSTSKLMVLEIEGLKPPEPVSESEKTAEIPDEPNAIVIDERIVQAAASIPVRIAMSVPEGFKRNELAPVTWDVFALKPQTLIPNSELAQRLEATLEKDTAIFTLPTDGSVTESSLLLRLTYGYCSADSSDCRLATASWKITLKTATEAELKELTLKCPLPKTEAANSDSLKPAE